MSNIDINSLTLDQIKEIAAIAAGMGLGAAVRAESIKAEHNIIPVIACTDKRGVFFGYTTDVVARPLVLSDARMCIYWSSDVGGVLGLGDMGPTKDCRISATVSKLIVEGVTAVYSVSEAAEKAWRKAPVQGR